MTEIIKTIRYQPELLEVADMALKDMNDSLGNREEVLKEVKP